MDTANIIALAGLGILVMSVLLPYTGLKISPRVAYGGIVFGLLLVAISAIQTWDKLAPGIVLTGLQGNKSIDSWTSAIVYGVIFASLMQASVWLFQMSMKRPSTPDDDTWKTPSSHDLLKIYEETKGFAVQFKESFVVKIKIIATEKGKPAAESLVEFFTYCKWEMEVNHEDGSYIFPSPRPFKGALIKFRASNRYLSVSRQVLHPSAFSLRCQKQRSFRRAMPSTLSKLKSAMALEVGAKVSVSASSSRLESQSA